MTDSGIALCVCQGTNLIRITQGETLSALQGKGNKRLGFGYGTALSQPATRKRAMPTSRQSRHECAYHYGRLAYSLSPLGLRYSRPPRNISGCQGA